MSRWWMSWYSVGSFTLHTPWWVSGYAMSLDWAEETATICAAVEAPDEEGAKQVILDAHDDYPETIEWRFVSPRPDDWEPFCERFPRAEWMRWPAGDPPGSGEPGKEGT